MKSLFFATEPTEGAFTKVFTSVFSAISVVIFLYRNAALGVLR
jgi:hypothetical protein